MYMKRLVLNISFACLSTVAFSQGDSMAIFEEELLVLLDELRAATNDADKAAHNDTFKAKLQSVLDRKESMNYSFPRLSTVGFIDSPDKLCRIVNWNVEQDDQSQRYYSFVQRYDRRRKKFYNIELQEDPFGVREPEGIVEAADWYGALYYKIIPVRKGRKTIYTLLGWDGNTSLSTSKLVDAMYFTGNKVKFGSPIFDIGTETKYRLFYEHADKVTMTLTYEESRHRIMMDHLAPESPSLAAFRSFYVPDLSYDALEYQKSKWVLKEDVIGVNDHNNDDKYQYVYVQDPETGKPVRKKIEREWQNPEDPNAPVGGNEHIAVTPEEADGTELNKDDTKKKRLKRFRRDERDPSELSTTHGDLKKRKTKKKRN